MQVSKLSFEEIKLVCHLSFILEKSDFNFKMSVEDARTPLVDTIDGTVHCGHGQIETEDICTYPAG